MKIIEFYAEMVVNNKITIEQVPEKWRDLVRDYIENH